MSLVDRIDKQAWVVSADMGYGHQRAVHPLKSVAYQEILNVGSNSCATKSEAKLWKRFLNAYEFMSRAKSLPLVGNPIFGILDTMLRIPTFYPLRDLSNKTFQVDFLEQNIGKGLCSGMLERIKNKDLPLVTSFYAPAIAANMHGNGEIYCIICDADINRVWVAKEPWESRIVYFAPCGKAAQRLKAYGVPSEKIVTTGFPLPLELLGSRNLNVLKRNLALRLKRLDPKGIFWARHGISVKHFLGDENCNLVANEKITIVYSVGGAGAQKEIGAAIAKSLKDLILENKIKLYLAAGIKENVKTYFDEVVKNITTDKNQIEIVYEQTLTKYFDRYAEILHETDILWTKPSELSFYCALGLPIIMAPAIGSQEKFNRKWLIEIRAGIKQIKPEFAHQWLIALLNNGSLAEAAWSGFLRARKLGTYNIMEILETGRLKENNSPVMR